MKLAVAILLAAAVAAVPVAAAKVVEVHLVATGDGAAPYAFEPANVEVGRGDSVRWINDEQVFHTATSTDNLEARRANGDWSHTLGSQGSMATQAFEMAGVFHYFCQPHASFMAGTITVTGSAGGSPDGEESTLPAAVGLAGLLFALVLRRR